MLAVGPYIPYIRALPDDPPLAGERGFGYTPARFDRPIANREY
jgi:hypothetical protein